MRNKIVSLQNKHTMFSFLHSIGSNQIKTKRLYPSNKNKKTKYREKIRYFCVWNKRTDKIKHPSAVSAERGGKKKSIAKKQKHESHVSNVESCDTCCFCSGVCKLGAARFDYLVILNCE